MAVRALPNAAPCAERACISDARARPRSAIAPPWSSELLTGGFDARVLHHRLDLSGGTNDSLVRVLAQTRSTVSWLLRDDCSALDARAGCSHARRASGVPVRVRPLGRAAGPLGAAARAPTEGGGAEAPPPLPPVLTGHASSLLPY